MNSAHDELNEVIRHGDPIAGEGDTRTDPYFILEERRDA